MKSSIKTEKINTLTLAFGKFIRVFAKKLSFYICQDYNLRCWFFLTKHEGDIEP